MKLLKFEFLAPMMYGSFASYLVLKYEIFHIGLNLLTISVVALNMFMAYMLYILGRMIDKCLEHLFY